MLSTSSKELGTRHQTPTLIGCIFLKTPQNKSDRNLLHFANSAAISEALNSSTVFEELSKLLFFRFILATPATCSNHLHRAKPCILYRFLTTKKTKPNFLRQPPEPSAATPKHRHKPPQEPEHFCAQASAAKPSTIARFGWLARKIKHATFPGASQDSGCRNLRRAGGSRDCSEGTRRSSLAKTSTAPWSRSPRCAAQ